jgi:hypothetical protein
LRDRVAARLLDLGAREMFVWGWMQTDPNLANFLWDGERGQVVLLDFGAVREVPPALADLYRGVMRAALDRDRAAAEAALEPWGAGRAHPPAGARGSAGAVRPRRRGHAARGALRLRPSPLCASCARGGRRLRSTAALAGAAGRGAVGAEEARRAYLLAARLGARVDLRALLGPYL